MSKQGKRRNITTFKRRVTQSNKSELVRSRKAKKISTQFKRKLKPVVPLNEETSVVLQTNPHKFCYPAERLLKKARPVRHEISRLTDQGMDLEGVENNQSIVINLRKMREDQRQESGLVAAQPALTLTQRNVLVENLEKKKLGWQVLRRSAMSRKHLIL